MRRWHTMWGSCVLAGLTTACVVEQPRRPPRPQHNVVQPIGAQPPAEQPQPAAGPTALAFGAGGAESLPPATMPAGVARARPLTMHPAAPPATWIWLNRRGQWRVRMTSGGAPMRFQGKVAGVNGPIVNVVVSRMELSDRIGVAGGVVTYDFETGGGLDGFDFEVGGNGCVRIVTDPGIASAPRSTLVGAGIPAPSPHFILCP